MGMLDIHKNALKSRISAYHEFLGQFKKGEKVVYGFVEGNDDPIFYLGYIESMLPDDWEIKLFSAGGKENVLAIHKIIDWRRFKKKQICFFIDRDLSEMIPEKVKCDSNIYITSGYSIENYIVKSQTCARILNEVYGFDVAPEGEIKKIKKLFDQELNNFCQLMIPLMAVILRWRRHGEKANLNNVVMKSIFTLNKGIVSEKNKSKSLSLLHTQCGVTMRNDQDYSSEQSEFKVSSKYRKYTRGKYLLWFMVEFCKSVHRDAIHIVDGLSKQPKKKIDLSLGNSMCVVGPRAKIPSTLREFLESNYMTYLGAVS